jgi:hypothetical protein
MYVDPSGYVGKLAEMNVAIAGMVALTAGIISFSAYNVFSSLTQGLLQPAITTRITNIENSLFINIITASSFLTNYTAYVANSLIVTETIDIIPSAEQAAQVQQLTTVGKKAIIEFDYAKSWVNGNVKTNKGYQYEYVIHHIVPRYAHQAQASRDVLNKVGINIFIGNNYAKEYNKSPQTALNLVKIKSVTHVALHINNAAYCGVVNGHIVPAYYGTATKSKSTQKRAVESQLILLGTEIIALDSMFQ